MPGLGRFSRGKPPTPSGGPAPAPAPATTPEAMPEDEGNWMQFDDTGMDFGDFGGDGDGASFGFPDTTTLPDDEEEEEEEETQEQQDLPPPPTNAPNQAAAPALKRLGLNMFKNKATNVQTTTTQASTTNTNTIDKAGDTVIQAPTSVPDASATTDFQNRIAHSGSIQDTPMTESSQDDSGLAFSTETGNNAPNVVGGAGLAVFAQAQAPLRQQAITNQGGENSTRSGSSLLARISANRNVINNSNMNPPATGASGNTLEEVNPPSNARTTTGPNLTPRATQVASAKILPPMRSSTLPGSLSSTRILPLPEKKKAPPSAHVPANKQSQPTRQGGMILPRLFTNRNPNQGQSTPQQPRVVARTNNLAKNVPHHQVQVARPASLQTPANNNSNGANPRSLLKRAPPAVTPSPSSRSNNHNNNPMVGDNHRMMTTTVMPPTQPGASPNQQQRQQRDADIIVPPPAPTAGTTTTTTTQATGGGDPNSSPTPTQDPSPDFNELHARFLSDIRDLEDTQNFNADRLLSMESNLAIAYSVLLQDQFQFVHLLEQLEEITKETDQAIAKYQQQAA